MKKILLITAVLMFSSSILLFAKNILFKKAYVDFDAFEKLTAEVKQHRNKHLVSVDEFVKMSKEPNTIILDTRSQMMYDGKHIKGAKHLDFTDFTQANLAGVIPSFDTKILIYCNNNFENEPLYFATKGVLPKKIGLTQLPDKPLTLALNIPTYINLYGYGYKNVYELSELITLPFDNRVKLEGAQQKNNALLKRW